MQEKEEKAGLGYRILTVVGIALCVLLTPILIINCTLFIKGTVNKDKVPSFCTYVPLIVLTGSMEDEFPAGSLIITKEVSAEKVKEGDIISYYDPKSNTGAIVSHKVRFIQEDADGSLVFYTYGTANLSKEFDAVTESDCEKIPEEAFIGRYTGVRFKGLGDAAMYMQTTQGFIVCVFVPALLLVGYDILRRRLSEKKHTEDKDELMKELEELRKLKAEQGNSEESNEIGDRR